MTCWRCFFYMIVHSSIARFQYSGTRSFCYMILNISMTDDHVYSYTAKQMVHKSSSPGICIIIKGDILRNPESGHFDGTRGIPKSHSMHEKSFRHQNEIMESIITHIILPYEKEGKDVFVSGCVYNCTHYDEKLKDYFPNHTIKSIQSGKTNAPQLWHIACENAEMHHPNCIEYVSMRADFLMLRNVTFKTPMSDIYTGFGYAGKFPAVDAFFITSNKAMPIFKKILLLGKRQNADTHYIQSHLRRHKVELYPIWADYKNGPTGITFENYITKKHLHKQRPFVNYMKNIV